MAERKRRITKGDTFTFCREEKTGELMVRCLFCRAAPYPFKNALLHVCKKEELNAPPPDPFVAPKPEAE